MLSILPVNNLDKLYSILEKEGIKYTYSTFGFVAEDEKGEQGKVIIEMEKECCRILFLYNNSNDIEITDGLVRAASSFAENRGLNETRVDVGLDNGQYTKLGFIKNENDYIINYNVLFKPCCQHKCP